MQSAQSAEMNIGSDLVTAAELAAARNALPAAARPLFDTLVVNGHFLVRPNLDGVEHKYQQASVVHALAHFGTAANQAEATLPAAVSIPTGTGKSRIIWALAAVFSLYQGAPAGRAGRTLVITPSIRIREGASDTWQALQNTGSIGEGTGGIVHLVPSTTFQATDAADRPAHWVSGILQDSGTATPTTAFRDAKVVVCNWQTLKPELKKVKEGYPAEGALDNFLATCGFANFIVDEAHHHSANSYQNLVKMLRPDRTVLLSACFERQDGRSIPRHTVFSRPLTWAETNRLVKRTTRHAVVFGDTVTVENVEVRKDQDPASFTCRQLEAADDKNARGTAAGGDEEDEGLDENEDDEDDEYGYLDDEEENDGDDEGMPTVPKAVRERLRRAIEAHPTIQERLAKTTIRAILDKKRETGCPIAGLCFCRDQKHALKVCTLLRSIRIPSAGAGGPRYLEVDYMSSDRPAADNDGVIRRLENGELDIVCVVAMLGEGYDYPLFGVATFFIALGNKARSKAYQATGRTLRAISSSHRNVPNNITPEQLSRAQNAEIFYLKCSCMSRLLMDIGIDNSIEEAENGAAHPSGGGRSLPGNARPNHRRRLNNGEVDATYAEEALEHHARAGGAEGGIAAGEYDATNLEHDLVFDEVRHNRLVDEELARRQEPTRQNAQELREALAAQQRAQDALNAQQQQTAQQQATTQQQQQQVLEEQAAIRTDVQVALNTLLARNA
ncbi:hypothetical protein NFJ02_06g129560 [Pycnococcus provasolii]